MVLLAVAGYLAVQYVTGGAFAPGCKVAGGKGGRTTYEFTPEQAVNAAAVRLDEGRITGLYAVRNPEKLSYMREEASLSR